MTQDENYDSGPWYNPENLHNNPETGNENRTKNKNTEQKSGSQDFLSETEDNALVFGTISMVVGIFSLLGEKLVLGIIGLIFGKISNSKKPNTYAKVGIICSIISIAIGIISISVVLVIFIIYGTAFFEILRNTLQIQA